MAAIEVPEVDYTEYTNRQLVVVPLAVLALALVIIGGWYLATGAPANLGLEFTGGTEVRLDVTADSDAEARAIIDETLEGTPSSVQSQGGAYVVRYPTGEADPAQIEAAAENDPDVELLELLTVSPSFSSDVQVQALGGIAAAFLGMSVLVFAMFRTFVPSVAVVVSAFSDIIVPIGIMNLLGIEMTLGTVAALLMIIGYSVDSDILLNNSVLRRTGGFYESVHRAMRTGVTMTITSIAAMIIMAIAATAFGIDLLRDIGIILAVGLCADLMNTYLINVALLRWYKYEGVRGR